LPDRHPAPLSPALIVTEVIVWWPDPPRKKTDERSPAREVLIEPIVAEPPPPPPPAESVAPDPDPVAPPPGRPGRDIPALAADPSDEIRQLEGCRGKRCGDPCVLHCDDPSDGRCVNGIRPGACTVDGECSYVLPAICPP